MKRHLVFLILVYAIEARALDPIARACADGSAELCAARRAAIASGALKLPEALPLAAGLAKGQLGQKLFSMLREKFGAIIGMAGGGGLFSKIENMAGLLEAHGGDLGQALASGQLLPLAQEALGAAKAFLTENKLGNGQIIDRLQAALPSIAAEIKSSNLNLDGLMGKLKQEFPIDQLMETLTTGRNPAAGNISPVAASASMASDKFSERLRTILPP